MNKEMITGFIRHLLTFGGGWMTTAGISTAEQTEAIIGGIVALVGVEPAGEIR